MIAFILFAAAVMLHGAKTDGTLSLWALGLSLTGIGLMTRIRPQIAITSVRRCLLVYALAGLSWVVSVEPGAGWTRMTQITSYLTFWLILVTEPRLSVRSRWIVITLLALLTGSVSLHEGLRCLPWPAGWTSAGWFPVNPVFNATWMATFVLWTVWATSQASPRRLSVDDWPVRTVTITAGLLSLFFVCLLFYGAQARSAFLGFCLGMLWLALRRWQKQRRILLFAGICLSLLLAATWPLLETRLRLASPGWIPEYRPWLWSVATWIGLQHPWAGIGPGCFESGYLQNAFPAMDYAVRFAHTSAFAHNEFLQLFSEFGWTPLCLAVLGCFTVIRPGARRWDDPAIASEAILITLITVALFNPVLHLPAMMSWFLIHAYGASRLPSQEEPPHPTRWDPLLRQTLWLIPLSSLLCAMGLGLRTAWAGHQGWDRLVRFNPWDAQAWHQRALTQSDATQSLKAHRESVRRAPANVYNREALARALESVRTESSLDEALDQYRQAIHLAPGRAINGLALGRILFQKGRIANAEYWFRYALQMEPFYWEADLWLARARAARGDRRGARFLLEHLPVRRREMLSRWPSALHPDSPYEEAILRYEDSVVQNELARGVR